METRATWGAATSQIKCTAEQQTRRLSLGPSLHVGLGVQLRGALVAGVWE